MSFKQQIKPEDRVIREYLRVSSLRQRDDDTIKTQSHALLKMVKAKYGAQTTIQKTYVDNGFSGTNTKRPGLDALRKDLEDKSWNTVAMFSSDRLSRDFYDGDKLREEILAAGKEIVYADGTSP